MKLLIFIISLVLAGCATTPLPTEKEYLTEIKSMNPVEICYTAHYDARRTRNNYAVIGLAIKYGYVGARQDTEKRKHAALAAIEEESIECDLMELAKLNEMRKQSSAMQAQTGSSSNGQDSRQRNSEVMMRCSSEGRSPDWATGGCL